MSTLTIRLPDDTAERLKALARSRGLSMNKLVEELSTQAALRRGTPRTISGLCGDRRLQQALAILDRLDGEDRMRAVETSKALPSEEE